VPPNATTGPISVTTAGGTASSPSTFKVSPKIDSLSPTSGLPGASITLTGTSFTGATAVRFGAAIAVFTVDTDSTIRATVPATASTGPISVTTPGGTAT